MRKSSNDCSVFWDNSENLSRDRWKVISSIRWALKILVGENTPRGACILMKRNMRVGVVCINFSKEFATTNISEHALKIRHSRCYRFCFSTYATKKQNISNHGFGTDKSGLAHRALGFSSVRLQEKWFLLRSCFWETYCFGFPYAFYVRLQPAGYSFQKIQSFSALDALFGKLIRTGHLIWPFRIPLQFESRSKLLIYRLIEEKNGCTRMGEYFTPFGTHLFILIFHLLPKTIKSTS